MKQSGLVPCFERYRIKMSGEPTIIDCEKMEMDDEPEVIKEILSENTKDK